MWNLFNEHTEKSPTIKLSLSEQPLGNTGKEKLVMNRKTPLAEPGSGRGELRVMGGRRDKKTHSGREPSNNK